MTCLVPGVRARSPHRAAASVLFFDLCAQGPPSSTKPTDLYLASPGSLRRRITQRIMKLIVLREKIRLSQRISNA
jgi:hypothetical protein